MTFPSMCLKSSQLTIFSQKLPCFPTMPSRYPARSFKNRDICCFLLPSFLKQFFYLPCTDCEIGGQRLHHATSINTQHHPRFINRRRTAECVTCRGTGLCADRVQREVAGVGMGSEIFLMAFYILFQYLVYFIFTSRNN